jgi:hypothetical protein
LSARVGSAKRSRILTMQRQPVKHRILLGKQRVEY